MSQEESTFQNHRDDESNEQETEERKLDIPLFMEDKPDSPHGNKQDEKDETEE